MENGIRRDKKEGERKEKERKEKESKGNKRKETERKQRETKKRNKEQLPLPRSASNLPQDEVLETNAH